MDSNIKDFLLTYETVISLLIFKSITLLHFPFLLAHGLAIILANILALGQLLGGGGDHF